MGLAHCPFYSRCYDTCGIFKMNFIKSLFVWFKSLIFIILSLPFLVVGAVALALALLGVLVGLIGGAILMLAGIVKIDSDGIKKAIENATKG